MNNSSSYTKRRRWRFPGMNPSRIALTRAKISIKKTPARMAADKTGPRG
jgi:hypothetical protein